MKIKEIKTIQAQFGTFKVVGFLEKDVDGGDVISIYWQPKDLGLMSHVVGTKINIGFEADFKEFIDGGYIINSILEECESKMESDNCYDTDSYLKVYKEISEQLN